MKKSWSNVGDLQGQIPFTTLSYELTGLDGSPITTPLILNGYRIEINIRGQLFSVVDNIVPSTPITNYPSGLPFIRFNDVQSDPLELAPFSIFKLDYSRIFIDVITTLINNTFPRTYSTKPTLISSGIAGVDIKNFRTNGKYIIGRNGSTAFSANSTETLNFPVPVGSKRCTVLGIFTVGAGDMTITISGVTGNQITPLFSNVYVAGAEVDLSFDCSLYDHIYYNLLSSVGYTGNLSSYLGVFV